MKRSACLTARSILAVALALATLPAGCVTRRYVITSDPPGAVVFRDGQPIGATPVEAPFIYYGKYDFRLVKDGYEPLDVSPTLVAPWYEYPGVDFVTENLIPYTWRDRQVFPFVLKRLTPPNLAELTTRAGELRGRGKLIQPPPGIVQPFRPPSANPQPPPLAPGLPAPPPGTNPPGLVPGPG